MRILKNIISIILIATMIFTFTVPTYSKTINELTDNNIYAKVIQVLDGDAIKVQLQNKDTAYVKIKGIDAKGFDASYDYLTSTLLGQNVTLIKDGTSYTGGKFNYMLVYYNGKNIGNEMVSNGYAIIDKKQDKGNTYNTLSLSQDNANTNSLGMWRFENVNYSSITGSSGGKITQTNDKININTATKDQLQTLLKNVSLDLAKNIVNYREKNPFSNIQEIKFVDGFTKEIYDKNKYALTVCTNINTANEFELKTLNNMSDTYINNIISKRNEESFSSTSDIISIISKANYDKISDYISIKDYTTIDVSKNSYRANISLSNKTYLTQAGVPYYFADDIIAYRKNGYTYKTLMELSKLGTNNITEKDINFLEDNLNVLINLNTDNILELNSVFGTTNAKKIYSRVLSQKEDLKDLIGASDYNKVKDIVYVGKNNYEYININTASKQQMTDKGISTTAIYKFMEKRPIRNPLQLPLDVSDINSKISLYTNINTASKLELQSLNNGITDLLIDKIIKYREEDNFGSLEEVEQFFKANNGSIVYDKIKSYIVVR